jgi:DNA ligase-3
MTENKFALDYSKRLSKCQKCKKEMAKGEVRLAKIVPNFFGGEGDNDNDAAEMKQYHHIDCLFDSFKRAKATTKIIESADDIRDFALATDADKKKIVKAIKGSFTFLIFHSYHNQKLLFP